jgi:glycosyltransferase involved in cell wall biosynthesis
MSRRVAVVFPFRLEAGHLGKDLFLIPEGLRRLGYEVELHCPAAQPDVPWPLPVITAGPDELERPEHYAGRDLGAAIVFSFLRFPRLLAAVRPAVPILVAKGDTTGQSLVRAHPRATLVHALHDQPRRTQRARAVLEWLARLGPLAGRDARQLHRVLRIADVTVVETEAARDAVRHALVRTGAAELDARLRVLPNPVEDAFTTRTLQSDREPLVVAVGRWDVAAKDAPLLARTLDRFLADHPDQRAVVAGDGGDGVFGERVERVGRLPQEALAPLLGRARIIVTSSHWESFSLSSHEGLAMGCTVSGPALQPLRDAVALGPYGTLAERRSARGLAGALAAEAAAWDAGRRDPLAGAAFWRARLRVDAVAERFADLLDPKLPLSPA